MIVIPAVDLRDGKCVQLIGGSYAEERIRLDDPLAVARHWRGLGFRRLHVVDLDAATGHGSNTDLVHELIQQSGAEVQAGGGVRDGDTIDRLIAQGAVAVVVGTRAVEEPDWLAEMSRQFPDSLIVAADARDRHVVTRGWTRLSPRNVLEFVEELNDLSLAGVMVTAVHREGTLAGTDLPLMEDVAELSAHPVLASGGIATMTEIHSLADRQIAGVILGMALYTGELSARAVADEFNDEEEEELT